MINFREYLNSGSEPTQQLKPVVSQPKAEPNVLQKGINAVGGFIRKDLERSPVGQVVRTVAPQVPKLAQNAPKIATNIIKPVVDFQKDFSKGYNAAQVPRINVVNKIGEVATSNPKFKESTVGRLIQGDIKGAITSFPKTISEAGKPRDGEGNIIDFSKLSPEESKKIKMNQAIQMGLGTIGGPTGTIKTKINKTFEPAVKMLKGRLNREDVLLLDQFSDAVSKAGGQGNKVNLGGVGDQIQTFLEATFGKKTSGWTNTQARDAIQYVMKRLSEEGANPGIGLSMRDVSKNFSKGAGVIDDVAKTPVQKVIDALTTAKPLQKGQQAAYTQARGERISTARELFESAGGGREGAFARKGAFKGELAEKAEFEGIEGQLAPEDIDSLHNMINENQIITEFEKIPAATGLEKLFAGKVPTKGELELLDEVFGGDFTKAALTNLDKMSKIKTLVANVANIPRSIQSSMDLSAPLRQGIVMAPSHPRDFLRSFKNMFGYTFSQKKFDNFYTELQKRPTYPKMRESGLAITDMGSLSSREEAFQSSIAEKIPFLGNMIKASGRGYTGFLNNFRADLFDTLVKGGEKLGKGDDQKYLKSLADFINTATGRGKLSDIPFAGEALESSAPLLNAAFFSPRLIASRVSFFNPAMYARMDPTVRKEAAKSIVAFVGTGLTLLGAAKLAGSEVETDPTSADFGKIKVGDTRYDIWGGFQPYATFIARMILNRQKTTTGVTRNFGEGFNPKTRLSIAGRFLQGKLSPTASFGVDALAGQDFEYNKFDVTNPNVLENPLAKRLVPLMVNDITKNIEEYGSFGPVVSIPGFFGVGQATYEMKPQGRQSKSSRPSIGTSVR